MKRATWTLVAAALLLLSSVEQARADWVTRTVTAVVDGVFTDIQPTFGYEVGIGTQRLQWGNPLTGSFASFLSFQGYDAFPDFQQDWFYPGQSVLPGQEFLAGTITFGNGTVSTDSTSTQLSIKLSLDAFGAELKIDNHPFNEVDTVNITVVQTPNQDRSQLEDADYMYFPNFPSLGSFRVFEGRSTSVPVYVKFGSIDPVRFGDVEDPTAGAIVSYVTPTAVPEPSSFALLGTAAIASYLGWRRRKLAVA